MSRKRPSVETSDSIASWINAFTPKNAEELAVHQQKIDSIRMWLKLCRPNRAQLLLITGPPGCGKTACVRVLAQELDYDLHEWLTPSDTGGGGGGGGEYTKENPYQRQQVDFEDFLFKTSRYQSLFHQKRRLLLVEDFPNIVLEQKALFHEILGRYKEMGKSPLIFLASETRSKSLNIAYNLFPGDVQSQFGVQNIALNAISATLMKKALQNLLANLRKMPGFKDRFREPTAEVLDSIIVSSQGDIRNAILNLQFVSQKSLPQVSVERVEETSNKDLNAKRTKRTKDTNKLKEIGRDETISVLHGVGRVLNPKFDATTKRLSHCPEVITDAFSTQPSNFLQLLFSNYLAHFPTVGDVAACAQELSVSDRLLSEYRDQALSLIALNVAIRGAMVTNSAPVSGWHPVKGHKSDRAAIEDAAERHYGRFIEGRNLVSKNTFVMEFQDALQAIRGVQATTEEAVDVEEEELQLIQQIETVDSD